MRNFSWISGLLLSRNLTGMKIGHGLHSLNQIKSGYRYSVMLYLRKSRTDVAVPDIKFRELYNFSKKAVQQSGIIYLIYGHFGNSHMHLNILPRSEEEYLRGKIVYDSICKRAVELGGTISAEHGIGKLKTDYFLKMYGIEIIKKMAELKNTLDPNMILGPGNIFKTDII